MRLIFIALLSVNFLIAVWGLLLKEDDAGGKVPKASVAAVRSAPDAGSIPVVDALSVEASLAGGAEVVGRQEGGAVNPLAVDSLAVHAGAGEKKMCELVGAFDDVPAATIFLQRLDSIGVDADVHSIELVAGYSYWVHLPPELNADAAYRRLVELQSSGVESYVIRRGELENAISLGVFTYENLAVRRQEQLKGTGLAAEIKRVDRNRVETWVVLQPDQARKLSDLTWVKMLEGMSSQERRQNICLDVASGDNFH